jgi:hypothetical protein
MADAKSPLCLESALAFLYTPAHGATFRLLVDAVIARRHLRRVYESSWASFVLSGQTKSGKSLLTIGACRLFGLDDALLIRSVPSETERSMWGRRILLPGGQWSLQRSPVLDFPILGMDELDKAPKATHRACLKSLQGLTSVPGEEAGEKVEVAAVCVVSTNGWPSIVPEEYRRRSVVLDTRTLEDELPADRAGPAQAFLDALPRWDLDALQPPDWPLPPIVTKVVEAILPGLNEDGQRLYDERSLALLALGRAAWTGFELDGAVDGVVGDYLDTADTVFETFRPTSPQLTLPDATAQRLADERRAAEEAEDRRQARVDTLAQDARKGNLIDELANLAKAAKGNRAQMRQIRRVKTWIDDTETAEELDELEDDLDALREARPVTSDHDRFVPTAWWCARCHRVLGPHELDSCASCGQIDEIMPANTWMQLADTFGRATGQVIDVQPLGNEPTPVVQAYLDTEARLPATTRHRPALPPARGPVYLGSCGCAFAAPWLAEHQWSTSVICPRHRTWATWTVETCRPAGQPRLPGGEPEWTLDTHGINLELARTQPP